MPLCPQITNTPTVLPRQVAITAVSYTSTTATYTASGHSFIAGDVVVITGLVPAGYNGTFTISSVSGSTTFTVPNTTNATVTDQSGLATPGGVYSISSVLPVVTATTTQVNAAQSTATTALANAATAYNAAIGSLQPSASTIVNASNQMTAIAANGITVYSGSSASSGARVVMNSLGLAGFNSGGSATFSISASTGAAVFSGSVTGSTITGGTLNIGGNAIIDASGFLTASGATVTGAINATSGYIGSASNGWNFSANGFLTNSGGSTILYPTTAPGGNANTYSIFTDRGVYAERIYSTGTQASSIFSLGGLSINGGISSGGGTFTVNTSGAITATTGITATGAISTSGNISTTGSGTITSAGSLTGASLQVNGSATLGTSNTFEYLSSSGTLRSLYTYGVARTSSTRTMIIDSNGNFGTTASTQRKKHEIQSYAIDSSALLQLDVKQFKYKPEFDPEQQIQHGFIAEEAQSLGLDELIQYDSTGVPDYFAYEKLPIFLLQLIKELKAEIDQLKGE